MILIDGKEWRPISFVDELVRRILEDLKTETRRIIRGVPYWDHVLSSPRLTRPIMDWPLSACYLDDEGQAWLDIQTEVDDSSHRKLRCPYGKPGDRLWVREQFATFKVDWREVANRPDCALMQAHLTESSIKDADIAIFRDGTFKARNSAYDPNQCFGKAEFVKRWRPPMHLPFWGWRIGLEVKSIGIERVQEITEGGACAEGFQNQAIPTYGEVSALFQFRKKWDQINGNRKDKSSGKLLNWDLNPFVWVVNFKRVKP